MLCIHNAMPCQARLMHPMNGMHKHILTRPVQLKFNKYKWPTHTPNENEHENAFLFVCSFMFRSHSTLVFFLSIFTIYFPLMKINLHTLCQSERKKIEGKQRPLGFVLSGKFGGGGLSSEISINYYYIFSELSTLIFFSLLFAFEADYVKSSTFPNGGEGAFFLYSSPPLLHSRVEYIFNYCT